MYKARKFMLSEIKNPFVPLQISITKVKLYEEKHVVPSPPPRKFLPFKTITEAGIQTCTCQNLLLEKQPRNSLATLM